MSFIYANILRCIEVSLHKLNPPIVVDQFFLICYSDLTMYGVKYNNLRTTFSNIQKEMLT